MVSSIPNWREVKLGDVCSFSTKKTDVNCLSLDNYISTENMLPNRAGICRSSSLPNIYQTIAFDVQDILVSNIRPYFKKIWYATYNGGCSNDVLVIKAKKDIDTKFLYYILSDDKFFDYATATAKGTKMPRGDKVAIMKYHISLPPVEVQRKIAGVLGALDDKIELNNKINQNLELQAQALFCENLHKKSYPIKPLFDVATIKYGKGLPTNKLTKNGYKVFGGNGIIGHYSEYLYEQPQILISCRGAASGTILESHPFCYVTNNSLVVELTDRRYYEFLKRYLLLNQLHSYATGSAQPQITIDNLKGVEIPYPEYEDIKSLSEALLSISKNSYQNLCENEKLSTLRDVLLPKLMSGEIDVSQVDISAITSTDKLSFTEV